MHKAVSDTTGPLNIPALLAYLQRRSPAQTVRLVETHISWVLITEIHTYKIKKPVKFTFVDFLDSGGRHHFCQEELRLNRRLAPDIYLAVVPITRNRHSGQWSIDTAQGPADEIVDWAVKMKTFQCSTLDLAEQITPQTIDALADRIAHFHLKELPLDSAAPFGTSGDIAHTVLGNVQEIAGQLPAHNALATLAPWTEDALRRLSPFFETRKSAGFIKECHGDLHLANIALDHRDPVIFDCIEFSQGLRCIDVINEVAFLYMDLIAHGHDPLAWRFANRWCEHTGDYAGLAGLSFYAVYRALVRAKISLHQNKPQAADRYLHTAVQLAEPRNPEIVLMHGISGSGKTVVAQRLLESTGMIRIRSDVERKRLFGLGPRDQSQSALNAQHYDTAATQATFAQLYDLSSTIVRAGFPVIVDATFLKRALRTRFIGLARDLGVPARIVDVQADPDRCRARIIGRQGQQSDASEATPEVLEHQLRNAEPLDEAERLITETVLN